MDDARARGHRGGEGGGGGGCVGSRDPPTTRTTRRIDMDGTMGRWDDGMNE